jgi:DNA-binding IclR family transcriptional regulator
VAVAVRDHNRRPIAAVAVTYTGEAGDAVQASLAGRVAATAAELTRRIGG